MYKYLLESSRLALFSKISLEEMYKIAEECDKQDKDIVKLTEKMVKYLGHSYEGFNDADVSICMNKKDVALLIREMSAWLAGDEGSDDYGTMPEITFSHISHEDNHLSKEEYGKVLDERAKTFGWTKKMRDNHQ